MVYNGDMKPINLRRHFDRLHSGDFSEISQDEFKRKRSRFEDSGTTIQSGFTILNQPVIK